MEIETLFAIQKRLNERIVQQHDLEEAGLTEKRLLALLVELGELANETRCFKYWSNKEPSPQAVILEEYVDCLHFILSIGLDIRFTDVALEIEAIDLDLTQQFLELFSTAEALRKTPEPAAFNRLWHAFLALGGSLGFSTDQIEQAYLEKNKENHRRQATGY